MSWKKQPTQSRSLEQRIKLPQLNLYCILKTSLQYAEADIQTCSVKKVFLEISQNLQKKL